MAMNMSSSWRMALVHVVCSYDDEVLVSGVWKAAISLQKLNSILLN